MDCACVVRVAYHWYVHSLFFSSFLPSLPGTKLSTHLGDGPHYFHFFHCLSDIYKTNNMMLSESSTFLISPPIYERPMTKPVKFEDLQLRIEPSTIDIADKLLGLEHMFDRRIPMQMATPGQMTHLRILLSEKQLGSLRDGIATRRELQAQRCRGKVETCPDEDRGQDDQLRLSKNDCLTATLVVALNLSQSRICMSQIPSQDSDSTALSNLNQIVGATTVLNVSV
jgi:hypothetical protein